MLFAKYTYNYEDKVEDTSKAGSKYGGEEKCI
jgi:hypothetical protein